MTVAEAPSLTLDRLADVFDYAIVGPTDGRTRVLDARRGPYAAICHIERDFGDGRLTGCTGFLVSPRLVATAAHCVFSQPRQMLLRRGAPVGIRVTPGRNGAAAPFGQQWATRWWAHRRFIENADPVFDIAVIELPRPVAATIAPMRLSVPDDARLRTIRARRLLHIAGFPGDKPIGTMWEHAERLDRFTARALYYSVDTCPGHSGSPVCVREDAPGGWKVVGIHVAGPTPHERGPWGCRPGAPTAPAGAVNRGVRLTQDIDALIGKLSRGKHAEAFVTFRERRRA